MTDDVFAIGEWRTNSHMMVDVAHLGYLIDPVLDLTVGEKWGFWQQYRPASLVTNDVNDAVPADFHFDATRRIPDFMDQEFGTVVWDPPYKLGGTPQSPEMDRRFGTTEYRPRSAVEALLIAGMTEGARLARAYLLVKTMDMVNGGKVRWMTDMATQHAEQNLGLRKVDSLLFRGGRAQPAGRSQQHARRNYSTLLVFGRR